MKIVWDEPKRMANLGRHGMDFADLDLAFFDSAVIRPGHSGRLLAFGFFRNVMTIAVVFAPLGTEAISIVSMRPASDDERSLYDG